MKAGYLAAAFDEMKVQYGTIEDYFAKGLDVDATGRAAFRDRFVARECRRWHEVLG